MDFNETARRVVLEQIVDGASSSDLIAKLCLDLEKHIPGTVVGVTILDRAAKVFEHAIFPSLSDSYASALAGIAVKDKPGSCALAVFEGRTVVCDDVATDVRFSEGWKNLSLEHGLKALISIPTVQKNGQSLGTLVVAHPPQTPLSPEDRQMVQGTAEIFAQVLAYRRGQSRQALLVGELQHRIRNLFSAVGAVVYSTLRRYPDSADFAKVFEGRLLALSRAHTLALDADAMDLRLLLTDLLAPYTIDHDIDLTGPAVMLTQPAAVALSLATHELATNAVKYGALSSPTGRVAINWRLDRLEGDEPRFVLEWEERGGPNVAAPKARGFGFRTITHSVSAFDGAADLDFRPHGLFCTLDAPLSPALGFAVN